jgi:hypothetical protein
MIPFSDVVRLNQYAQGIRPMMAAKEWFSQLSGEQQQNVLRQLAAIIQQAHPLPSELPAAIVRAGLKPTHTPCVLMNRGPFASQAAKVTALPEQEREKSFSLFIALLGIVDARKRSTDCVNGCNHWWHQDLSNEMLVRRILSEQ